MDAHIPAALIEVLEWRGHGSHDFIAYTEFGPYMVDGAYFEKPRAWLPDEAQQCRIMCEGFASVDDAKAFCQQELDGRRALKMVKDCAVFLVENETPAERIKREMKDTEALIQMLADERAKAGPDGLPRNSGDEWADILAERQRADMAAEAQVAAAFEAAENVLRGTSAEIGRGELDRVVRAILQKRS